MTHNISSSRESFDVLTKCRISCLNYANGFETCIPPRKLIRSKKEKKRRILQPSRKDSHQKFSSSCVYKPSQSEMLEQSKKTASKKFWMPLKEANACILNRLKRVMHKHAINNFYFEIDSTLCPKNLSPSSQA